MIIEEFSETQLGMLTQLMNDETMIVKKMFLSSRTDRADVFYVFYEEAEEQLNKEKEEVGKLDVAAQKLEKDEAYNALKNQTQRELFLLQEYSIPSAQAKKTIELLNMRKILIENGLSRVFEKVICTICGKAIDEIYEEEAEQ